MAFPTTTPEQRKQRVDKLVEMLTKYPGLTQWRLARALGVSEGSVQYTLILAEDAGVLIYEDADGGLFPLADAA